MAKDYRRNSPASARRRDSRSSSCVYWFLTGAVLGAFGVGYAWMTQEPGAPTEVDEVATTRPPSEPVQERTFDFYSLLPEEEVVVPTSDQPAPTAPPLPQTTANRAPKPTPQPSAPTPDKASANNNTPRPAGQTPTSTSTGGDYVLQLGSFRSAQDAERLKAQLALKGIQTNIQTVTINDGQTYHRVRTGTYEKAAAQSMRASLERQGQESVMMRAR